MKILHDMTSSLRRQFKDSSKEEKILAASIMGTSLAISSVFLYLAAAQYQCAAEESPKVQERLEQCEKIGTLLRGLDHSVAALFFHR